MEMIDYRGLTKVAMRQGTSQTNHQTMRPKYMHVLEREFPNASSNVRDSVQALNVAIPMAQRHQYSLGNVRLQPVTYPSRLHTKSINYDNQQMITSIGIAVTVILSSEQYTYAQQLIK